MAAACFAAARLWLGAQVFDPEAAANTTAAGLHHKHKSTPYLGMPFVGRVLATFVRGQQVNCSRLLCGRPGASQHRR